MKTLNYPLLLLSACFFTLVTSRKDCLSGKKSFNSKLICYYSNVEEVDGCYCTHVILPPNADVKSIERVKQTSKGVKVYVSVNEFNQGLIDLLKSSKVDGLEINLKKLDSKNDISDFISTVKSKIGSHLDIALAVPSKSDLVAKYFDFKALSKYTDLFILETAFLGASTNVTFHPSRLSGMWDMQNTDSVVDLISGLGAPLSKLVIAAPVQAFQFTLQNEEYTAPGSPALELSSITRDELCKMMHGGKNWTLERDEDQAGPYIFRKNQWIAFEDTKSIDIKAKYSRIRGLAGIALKDLGQDGAACGSTILEATYNGLSRQARAPRGAVLHSLEREILESPTKSLDTVQLSPYRISRIIDTEGKIHVTRQDTRTEFQCSRQGYFVHPRSCNRFYRCVKFDQRSEDFNVFEFDCPAGLAFDERVEVCVWPGSLPHGTPCSGSSEIAPVPRKRFECPSEPGYYADPENCRWFFACLDHGKSPLSAYEFRCPFGLGFDSEKLVCEWPWLVPKCAGTGSGLDSEYYYGGANGYTGYSGKGDHSTGFVLQSYNGLGSLDAIKLGGVSGKIEKPISTVYSNVDGGALGLGYQNNGGYIVGGGLSYKAAQALESAGLLKVNNGAGYQASGQNQQGAVYATSNANSGNANIQYQSGYQAGSGSSTDQGAAVSVQGFTQYAGQNGAAIGTYSTHANENQVSQINTLATGKLEASGNSQYQGESGQYQDSFLHAVQGSGAGAGYANGGIQYQTAREQFGSGSSGQYQGVTVGYQNAQAQVTQASIDGSGYFHSDQSNGAGILLHSSQGNVEVNGAVSSQSLTQYHGEDQRGGSYVSDSGSSFDRRTEQELQFNGYNTAVNQQDAQNQQGGSYVYQYGNTGASNTGYEGNRQGVVVTDYTAAKKQQNDGYFASNGQVDQGSSANAKGGSYTLQSGAVGSGYEGIGQGIQVTGYVTANDQQNGGYIASNGQIDQGSVSGYANSGSYVSGKTDFSSDYSRNGGAVSAQSFTRYQGQQEIKSTENYGSGIRENVHIIGGGYSAVGTLNGVRVSNNGDSEDVKAVSFSSTASPLSVTTYAPVSTVSSIPTVTAVPVPGIRTSTGFETYKGGVIANIPALQYKIQSDGDSGFLKNISSSFANFIVTPPTTATKTQQTYSQDGGYVYEKPRKTFEEGIIKVSTARPFVAVTSQEPQVYVSSTLQPLNYVSYSTAKPAQSTISYQKYNEGYNYDQSSEFGQSLQGAVVNTYSTVSTARPTTFISQQPEVYVSSTPASPAVSTYSFAQGLNQKQGEYDYNKPEVRFEQGPKNPTIISKFTIRGPTAQKSVNTGSYYYENPAVKYEERPVVQLKQEHIVENYAYQQPAQPAVFTQYYQQSSIQQQPMVPLFKQPQLLATYTYQPPVQKTIYKQPVSTYTYQNVAQESLGLSQGKQQVTVLQEPAQNYSYQHGGGTSYQYINFENNLEEKPIEVERKGYLYPKPAIAFEEVPKNQVIPILSTPKPNLIIQDSKAQQGYVYEQPLVKFEDTHVTHSTSKPTLAVQPAVVISYFNTGSTHLKTDAGYEYSNQDIWSESVHQQNQGQEEIVYENPVYSTANPVKVQPAVVTSYFNIGTSKSQEQAAVERQRVSYSYPKPTIKFEETSPTYSTPRPAVDVQPVTPAVVTSYFNIQSSTPKPDVYVQEDTTYSTPRPISVGNYHPSPQIKFEEAPVSWSTSKPSISVQPAVSSYSFSSSSATQSEDSIRTNGGYTYQQPEIRYEEQPVQPAVVSSYNYISSTTPQPQNDFIRKQESINYTPQPQVFIEQKPAEVTSYFHLQPSKSVISEGYDNPKPAVQFAEEPESVFTTYENRQPVEEVPFIKKTAYVTGQHQQNAQVNYNYQKASSGRGRVVENYLFPNYEKVKQAVFGQRLQGKVQYEQPQVALNYVQSTPRPTFITTLKTIAAKKLQPVTPAIVTFYDSRLTPTPETYVSSTAAPEINIVSTTSRPISRFSFSSLDDEYQYNQNVDIVKSTTFEPTRTYLPATSRVRVTTALPKVPKTKVVEEYVAPEVTTLARDYLPAKIITKTPAREYLPLESTTPSREYLPSRQRLRVTSTTAAPEITTLHREYLPVRITTTGAPLEELSYTAKKPSAIRVVRPVAVIKQNDAHPLLSAKLGAQCTCVSNTLKLRKNQKLIIVEDDQLSDEDNDDDDGYIVDNGKQGQVIENYSYEPQKVVDITPVPDVYVKSTSVIPQINLKKRVRVRPVVKQTYLPVTEVTEVFYKKNISPAYTQGDSVPSDGEIVKAVRTGLKLVKQAAKEGAREGAQEAISGKQFDRYGPGGVRSKSETLQGSIDCQRAGLFRHPTECNKFYACRWDCTKNRFTLHVFNCPVHLTFDNTLGACNWPSQGPACVDNTLITSD